MGGPEGLGCRSGRFESVEKTFLVNNELDFCCVVVVVGYTWEGEWGVPLTWVALKAEGRPRSKTPVDIVNNKGSGRKSYVRRMSAVTNHRI